MSKHVVVVGGGIIGLCSAYYLVRQGHRVTLIDRNSATDENCSFGNAGLVVPSHIIPLVAPGMMLTGLKWMRDPESPFYVKPRLSPDLASWGWKFFRAGTAAHVQRSAPLLLQLNMASRAAFEELDAQVSGFEFQKRGLLMLFKTEQGLEEESHIVQQAETLGMPAQILDAQATAKLDPGVQMEIHGAAYYPNDCHLSPAHLMRALKARLDTAGVNFQYDTEVCDWKLDGRRVRAALVASAQSGSTERHEIEANEWVLCGGSWSPQMARRLRLSLPMQAGKGYSLSLEHPRQSPTIPTILSEARVAVTPMGKALRFAGTMEIAGLSTDVNPSRVKGIVKSIPNYYPQFSSADFADIKPWAGLRPCSPDGLPYAGRTTRYENLCIATGHAMMGLSLGPITGKLIAQTVSGQEPTLSSTLLNPDRYA